MSHPPARTGALIPSPFHEAAVLLPGQGQNVLEGVTARTAHVVGTLVRCIHQLVEVEGLQVFHRVHGAIRRHGTFLALGERGTSPATTHRFLDRIIKETFQPRRRHLSHIAIIEDAMRYFLLGQNKKRTEPTKGNL